MTSLDPIETRKILDSINKITPFISTNTDSDILWHWYIANPYRWKTFRDSEKNLWIIHDRDILVSIEAWINKAWVWDGQEPTHALTYSIRLWVSWKKRFYRCKSFLDCNYIYTYMYSRSIEPLENSYRLSLIEQYKNFISKNKIITL